MEKKKNFIINVIFYAMIGTAAFGICKFVLPALVPFLIAFLLCCAFYAVLFFIVIILGTKAVKGIASMVVAAPSVYNEKIVPLIGELAASLEEAVASVDAAASQQIEGVFTEISQNIGQYISDFSVKAVKWLSGGVTGIPGFVVKLVVTVEATFFMAADFPKITAFFQRRIPAGKEAAVKKGVDYMKNVIFIYIKSYSMLFSLTFVELSIGLLMLRIPYAILLALGIAVFDILPVLGTGGILLPWAVILLVMGNVPLAIGIAGMIVFPVALAVLVNMENNGILHRK